MVPKKPKPSPCGPSTVTPVAIPPKTPPEVRFLIEKLLGTLDDIQMPSLTEAQIHDLKALAHFTVAAFHISYMPDNQHRQTIIQRAVPLIAALVKENETARQRMGTIETTKPDETKH